MPSLSAISFWPLRRGSSSRGSHSGVGGASSGTSHPTVRYVQNSDVDRRDVYDGLPRPLAPLACAGHSPLPSPKVAFDLEAPSGRPASAASPRMIQGRRRPRSPTAGPCRGGGEASDRRPADYASAASSRFGEGGEARFNDFSEDDASPRSVRRQPRDKRMSSDRKAPSKDQVQLDITTRAFISSFERGECSTFKTWDTGADSANDGLLEVLTSSRFLNEAGQAYWAAVFEAERTGAGPVDVRPFKEMALAETGRYVGSGRRPRDTE